MFKKLVSILLVSLLVSSNLTVYAADIQNGSVQTQDEALVLPKRIENEIYSSIVQVYGEKQAKEIYDRVMQIARTSIENAGRVIVTDVYAASEDSIEGINGENFAAELSCEYVSGNMQDVARKLMPSLKKGDVVIGLGAGTITNLGKELCKLETILK